MADAFVPAYVVHSLPGRLRLRIPGKRGDESYFSNLSARVAGRREIAELVVNADTAGVLVLLTPGYALADLAAGARDLSLFNLKTSPVTSATPANKQSALMTAARGFKEVDRLVSNATGGYLDLKSSVFLALLAMAARQIIRGHFMVPGFTLLWHALNMMME